jgi:hypothetical protein
MKAKSLNYWRNYFQGVNSSIFEIIDNAIIVAATDHPNEFRLQRVQIAEKLYSCQLTQFCGHEHKELEMPLKTNNDILSDEYARFSDNSAELEVGGVGQTKVDSSMDDQAEMNMTQVSKYSYSEAEALTDEIDEESEMVGEVLRIKEILDNSKYEVCLIIGSKVKFNVRV